MTIKNKLIIGKNGLNWIEAAKDCFILERNLYLLEKKDYPNTQRGINANKWAKKLLKASNRVNVFIKDLKKQLII